MFLQTLGITQQIVKTAFNKCDPLTMGAFGDKRGICKRKMTEDDIALKESVEKHIKSFPTVDSHYTRKDSVKTYLENDLSLAGMYRLYLDFTKENYPDLKPAAQWKYREIFDHNFNIGFHQPKKDQCAECEAFKNSSEEEKSGQSNEYNAHLSNKNRARELKDADKTKAITDEKVCTAVFDFQKLLYCPIAQTNVFYYKRKLAIINFTVFDMGAKKGTCYMWNETQGKRGGNEVSSCLLKFITDACETGVQEFLFWSDNCIGQNKNQILFSMYCWIAKRFRISITHRFLEKGHTQNEGDSVHALIERVSRNKTIYSPEQWNGIIQNAKTTNKYNVVEMDVPDFLDFRKIKNILSAKKNTAGETVRWTRIREVRVSSEDLDNFTYKYSFDEQPQMICLAASATQKKGRPRKNQVSNESLPPPVRNQPWPLQKCKYDDLQYFCNGNYIPKSFHNFYKDLPYSDARTTKIDSDDSD
uniref:DUF7869 domain-containing protein n=1 Tax=Phlebotomus kandelakii TaxID=1109342 RepID=A0A6B2EIE4_9DIPT